MKSSTLAKQKNLQREKVTPWDIPLTIYADEAALLAGLRRKDRDACTCLFKQFAQRLYYLALRFGRDEEEAEDILQEGFLQACSHITSFEGKSSLGTWLHRIVSNVALMRLRKKDLPLVSLSDTQEEEVFSRQDAQEAPERQVLASELREELVHALEALPATLREPLQLRIFAGLSAKEAAKRLDITETAFKVRLHRARRALRQRLAEYVNVDEGRHL
ncbi:MAG TPA: sigma-70 family RNA polymerase sigma factor [Ktedonobacteraceae bacterium]|nr:sigma-70 family RNA polymerase sigma factor [Ktedonobacteraceae bacterium]